MLERTLQGYCRHGHRDRDNIDISILTSSPSHPQVELQDAAQHDNQQKAELQDTLFPTGCY